MPRSNRCSREDAAVEPVLAIEIVDPGLHFARAPLPDRLFEQPLLLCEIEIKHEAVPLELTNGLL